MASLLHSIQGTIFVLGLILVTGGLQAVKGDEGWVKSSKGILVRRSIYVDRSGRYSNFTTIQSAIDSVPHDNKMWVIIKIFPGVYKEQVVIPRNKPYIMLKGITRRSTHLVWDAHSSIADSPTFTSLADNIIVKSISIRNSYNNPYFGNPKTPAVAALIAGDRSYFFKVGFFGLQDTLWDAEGRHYFSHCTIEGAVDFIFGAGQSVYKGCHIHVIGKAISPVLPGFITAQARTNPNDDSGFVFIGCRVYGSGSAMLGRPWRGYARVLFYRCNLTSVVDPKGWDPWNYAGSEQQLTFSEYGCYGEGSGMRSRVSWEKTLSVETVEQMTNPSFIDSEGWLHSLPY